ncbi:alpha/beta fold hydrolase [Flagellimonas nanhaiensis]|nr:alpha/beta hydrolase [Allomuricauda nanhaiensis]
MTLFKRAIYVLMLFLGIHVHAQGKHITVDQGKVSLYYEDEGKGQPIIFIPGWTMTSQFFSKQKEHFKENYRCITYDPRSHGQSTKTPKGNTYLTHAKDLNQLIQKLELTNVVLVGWSSGCATIYEYVKLYGLGNLNRLIFIDEPPKWVGDTKTEWVYGSFDDYRGSLKDLISDRHGTAEGTVKWMLKKNTDSVETKWMVNQMLMTPNDVAVSLYLDGLVSDYSDVLKNIDGKLPLLFLLRDSWNDSAFDWIGKNVPTAKIEKISSHAMFWEDANRFNKVLESFLKEKN